MYCKLQYKADRIILKGGKVDMANEASTISVRINAEDKIEAEKIIYSLGLTPSAAIQMFYKQIIANNGLPFDVRLPTRPIATGNMSKEEIMEMIEESIESAKIHGTYTQEEVDEMLKKV